MWLNICEIRYIGFLLWSELFSRPLCWHLSQLLALLWHTSRSSVFRFSSQRGHRPLRPAVHGDMRVARCRTSIQSDRAFSRVGPSLWNTLPLHLRTVSWLSAAYICCLRTHLFGSVISLMWSCIRCFWELSKYAILCPFSHMHRVPPWK